MALIINSEKCTQDHKCLMLNFCPAHAISQVEFNKPVIDENKCFECRNCTYYCTQNAVERPGVIIKKDILIELCV